MNKVIFHQGNIKYNSASSKSTKLIHGGVRYLAEAFEFSTKGLSERI